MKFTRSRSRGTIRDFTKGDRGNSPRREKEIDSFISIMDMRKGKKIS